VAVLNGMGGLVGNYQSGDDISGRLPDWKGLQMVYGYWRRKPRE